MANDLLDLAGPIGRASDPEATQLYRAAGATYIDVLDGNGPARHLPALHLDRAAGQLTTARTLLDGGRVPPQPRKRAGHDVAGALLAVGVVAAVVLLYFSSLLDRGGEPPAAEPPAADSPVASVASPAPPPAADLQPVAEPVVIETVRSVAEPAELVVATGASRTWQAPAMVLPVGPNPAIARGPDEVIVVAHGTGLVVCTDAECRWPEEQRLPMSLNITPALEVSASGFPVLAYFDWSDLDATELRLAMCHDPLCQRPLTVRTLVAGLQDEGVASLAVDGSGAAVVAFTEPGRERIRVVRCADLPCSEFTSQVAATGDLLGYQVGIGLDPAELPLVAFYDIAAQHVAVVHCADRTCEQVDSVATVDIGPARVDVQVQLEEIAGLPAVVYGAHGELGVLRCSDHRCTTIDSLTRLPIEGMPLWLSTDAGRDGILHFAYMDRDTGLRFAVSCRDAACAQFDAWRLPEEPRYGMASVTAGEPPLVAWSGTNWEPIHVAALP